MRAIIIEDEPLSVAELRTTLAEVAPQIEVVATASSVAEAAAVIAGVGHDLIFMDIHLGDGSGFDIFQRTEISVPVIFITAYDSYALKAFENKGIDYLLKPFGREDLQRAIDKLGLLSGGGSASAEHGAPTQTPPVYQERFLVHMGARMKSVTTAEIAYFMADGKYLHLVTHDGKDYIVDRTLTEVGEKLPKGSLLFYTRMGYVKKTDWKEYAIQKYAFQAAKVNDGDEIIGIETDDPEPTTTLFFVTEKGMCLNAYKNDIPAQGRISAGVRGIALGDGDKVVFAGQIDGGEIIVATDGNTIKKVIASQIDPMARYRKGVRIVDLGANRKVVYADYVTEPYKFAVFMDDDTFVQGDTEEDITIEDRNTKGKNIKLKKGCKAKAFWSLKYLK